MQATSTRTPAGIRELVVGVGVLVLLSRFTDGAAPWIVAVLVFAAMLLGTLQVFHDTDTSATTHGVPIESLVDPAVLAFGSVGVARLIPVGLLEVPYLAVVMWLLLRGLALEARLARSVSPASAADRTAVLAMTMAAGLAAFAGIAALVPNAMPDPTAVAAGGRVTPASPSLILGLAAADGLIAFLLAYRVAALRSTSVRDVGWAASAAAVFVAIAAAVLRTLEIPGLLAPALLVLVFFLWEAMHSGRPARRRDPRRLWETLLLVALGLVVVVWSVGLRA